MCIMACLALWSVADGFIGSFYWKSYVGEVKTLANSLPNTLTVKHKENKSLTGKSVTELSQGVLFVILGSRKIKSSSLVLNTSPHEQNSLLV